MARDGLTRREFMGVAAAVFSACYTPSPIYAKGEKTIKWPKSGDDRERLKNTVIDVYPLIDCKDRVRIFEIATKLGEWSRASEVNKNTGEEYWEYKTRYSACEGTGIEDVERYIVCSQRDRMIIQRMYNGRL